MENGINVLSTFDGIATLRLALDRAGIKVNKYFASEINKHAIKVAQKNYPDIIQLGNIEKIRYENGVIYSENGNHHVDKFHLIGGGSPCKQLSRANAASGAQGLQGAESRLFYEWLRLAHETCADYFLLENVRMNEESLQIITELTGVEPHRINSALVSGQERKRLYWSNIPGITQPKDKGIRLADILQNEVDDKYYHSEAAINYMARTVKGGRTHWDFGHHSDTNKDKSSCITSVCKKGVPHNVLIDRRAVMQLNPYQGCSTKQPRMQHRIFSSEVKSPALTSFSGRLSIYPDKQGLIRRLTPIEVERLQTLPDEWTAGIADGHRYEAIGNGWTTDIIAHILKGLKSELEHQHEINQF